MNRMSNAAHDEKTYNNNKNMKNDNRNGNGKYVNFT